MTIVALVLLIISLCLHLAAEQNSLVVELYQQTLHLQIFCLIGMVVLLAVCRRLMPIIIVLPLLVFQCLVLSEPSRHSQSLGQNEQVSDQKNPAIAPFELSLIQYNIWRKNTTPLAIARAINDYQPDIVLIEELHQQKYTALKDSLQKSYFVAPALQTMKAQDMVIFSAAPLELISARDESGFRHYKVYAAQTIDVIHVHFNSPKNHARLQVRRQQIQELTHYLIDNQKRLGQVIIAGDFNSVPWHRQLVSLKNTTNIHHISPQSSFLPYIGSWPSTIPSLFRVPIDLMFASPSLRAIEQTDLKVVGSDHAAIYTRVVIAH